MSSGTLRTLAAAAAMGALLTMAVVSSVSAQQQSMVVQLGPGRDANTAPGTATLTDLGNGTTRVVIQVNSPNPDMLAHIHVDACPGVGAIVFPLNNVQNGTSTTIVQAPLSQVLAQGKSINLHQSPTNAGIYVACGNFAAANASAAPAQLPNTGDLSAVAPTLAAMGAGLAGAGYALRRRWTR